MASMAQSFNMSLGLNFSSIFTFPSKLVSRMRWVDEDWLAPIRLLSHQNTSSAASDTTAPVKAEPSLAGLGFFTSKYIIGLALMALVLHSIQNIIIPTVSRPRNRPPFNLASTPTRLALHFPTILLLLRTIYMWTVTLLQTSSLLPTPTPPWAGWVTAMSFGSVCWWTFLSVCASFVVDSFIRVLSANTQAGDNTGFLILENFMLQAGGGGVLAGHPSGGGAPFNLIGYAFLLHVYSNPLTHLFAPDHDQEPSRPDMHTVMTIGIPLIQVTLLHMLQVYKPWSNYRLIPTALSSILSLLHFHGTLWAWPAAWTASPQSPPPSRRSTNFPQYPLLNYIPSILETALISTIALTILLNALAQYLVSGRIQNLGIGLAFGRTEAILMEDFPILLLRLGTSSLEHSGSSGIRGWSNEGPEVTTAPSTAEANAEKDYGAVKMARDGRVMVLTRGVATQSDATHLSPGKSGRRKQRLRKGLANEIRSVGLVDESARMGGLGWLKCFVGNWSILKEGFVFLRCAYSLAKAIWRPPPSSLASGGHDSAPSPPYPNIEPQERKRLDTSDDVYEKFKRGEVVSDDEDSEWVESTPSPSDLEDEGDVEESKENPITLLSDFHSSSSSSSLANSRHGTPEPQQKSITILLAHLTSPISKGALTRRKYRSLLSSASSSPIPSQLRSTSPTTPPRAHFRRKASPPSQVLPSQCVVCISAPREIICWPCRCLTVCDECRQSLASGAATGSGASRCPCCRRVVEGYSRIYVP